MMLVLMIDCLIVCLYEYDCGSVLKLKVVVDVGRVKEVVVWWREGCEGLFLYKSQAEGWCLKFWQVNA